jgi:hypothetical protein
VVFSLSAETPGPPLYDQRFFSMSDLSAKQHRLEVVYLGDNQTTPLIHGSVNDGETKMAFALDDHCLINYSCPCPLKIQKHDTVIHHRQRSPNHLPLPLATPRFYLEQFHRQLHACVD